MITSVKHIVINIASTLVLAMFFSCQNDLDEVAAVTSKNTHPSETAENFTLSYTDSAKLEFRLSSPLVHHYDTDSSYFEFPKGVHVISYSSSIDSLGNPEMESDMVSDYAIRFEKRRFMEARGNVVITNIEGRKLETDLLYWDEKNNRIFTEENVKISTPGDENIIYGTGFESDQYFSKYTIHNTTGKINVKD